MPEQNMESAILKDRGATRQKIDQFVSLGKPIVEGSNLVNESSVLTDTDVEVARNLIQTISPVDIDNYRVHAHLELTAKFARKIGEGLKVSDPEKYKDLNLSELEMLGLFHDVGRFFSQGWFRNELIESHFLKKLGIRQDLISNIPNMTTYINKDPDNPAQVDSAVEHMPPVHKIIEMADNCGKRKLDGGILTFKEVMNYLLSSRADYQSVTGVKPVWPSERRLTSSVAPFAEKVYRKLYEEMRKSGVDLEQIRENILDEEKNSPVKAVIFDVGNVLIPNPDPQTIAEIGRTFDADPNSVNSAWSNLIPKMQLGQLSEEEFWRQFKEQVGRPQVPGYESLLSKYLTTTVDPEVKKIIDGLKANGIRVVAHSDVIPPQAKILEEAGLYDDFEQRILSFGIKTTKKTGGGFFNHCLKIGSSPAGVSFYR